MKDKSYVDLINKTIEQTIEKYIAPVDNPLTIQDIPTNELTLTIDNILFLDTLLMKIRGKTIHFGSKKKRTQNKREIKLIEDIELLETDPALNHLNTLIEDKKV